MAPPLRKIIISIIFTGLCFGLSFAEPPEYVRVAVLDDASSFRMKIRGAYTIIEQPGNKTISRGSNLNTTVTVYSGGINLGKVKSRSQRVLIKSPEPGEIIINGRTFRGDMQIIRKGNTLTAINYIDLEDYVKGISVRETSHYRPMESLKAEVIVFRTFAVYKTEEGRGRDFDLTSDVYSQVYGGKYAERYRINEAVEETKGKVITYRGRILPAFYHATCGGHTEDASLLWKVNLPPLKGVACGFCEESPHFKWHLVLSLKELQEKLAKAGIRVGDIEDITVLGKDKSGRNTELKITGSRKSAVISVADFRNAVGPNVLKSTNFSLKIVEKDVVFAGLGWGHGVGLCQWGAYFMAKQGSTYAQILQHYYPGSEISSLAELK